MDLCFFVFDVNIGQLINVVRVAIRQIYAQLEIICYNNCHISIDFKCICIYTESVNKRRGFHHETIKDRYFL